MEALCGEVRRVFLWHAAEIEVRWLLEFWMSSNHLSAVQRRDYDEGLGIGRQVSSAGAGGVAAGAFVSGDVGGGAEPRCGAFGGP